jgi:uncharacterized membrane protein
MNDKVKHIIAGFIIGFIACILCDVFNWHPLLPLLIVVLSGVGKEVYDRKTTGFDFNDIVADLGGGVIALWIYPFIQYIL